MPHAASVSAPVIRHGFLWKVSLIAGLGGILYGYDMGIIAAALIYVRSAFALSTQMEEIVVSVVLIGSLAGAVAGGAASDRFGRRVILLWGGAIFAAGSLLAPLSPNIGMLILARLLLGLAIGFTSVTAPVYVSEMSPPQMRGRLISLYQFALTVGIALADLAGYFLAGSHAWRSMFGLGAAPAVLFLALVLTVPESPRWLLANGYGQDALAVLRSLSDASGAQAMLVEIQRSLSVSVERSWSALLSPPVWRPLLIAVGFTVLQQVTGVNTIIYYGPRIFSLAGLSSDKAAIWATFLVAAVNVLATVIALVLVDKLGRKPLLYVGVGGMTLSLLVLSLAFHSKTMAVPMLGIVAISCLMVYIACFACSMGPIAWILVAEVFPLRLRSRGAAAATLGSGASNFLVSLTFLSLIQAVGNSATFAIYAGFCVLTLVFVRFVIPETRGVELETISAAEPSATA